MAYNSKIKLLIFFSILGCGAGHVNLYNLDTELNGSGKRFFEVSLIDPRHDWPLSGLRVIEAKTQNTVWAVSFHRGVREEDRMIKKFYYGQKFDFPGQIAVTGPVPLVKGEKYVLTIWSGPDPYTRLEFVH